jgi:hypothetical protein
LSSAFLVYINGLPSTISTQSKPILFANDTIVTSHSESGCFQNVMDDVFASLNEWIEANKLTLHFDKTNFMKFCTNNKSYVNLI